MERTRVRRRYQPAATQERKPFGTLTEAERQACGKSRLTNGSIMLLAVDGRSAWARRYRDLVSIHEDELGGRSMLTEGQLALIRRAALLQVELEREDSRLARLAEEDDLPGIDRLASYGALAERLRRLLDALGLLKGKQPRDITPTLESSDYRYNTKAILDHLNGDER